jgi:hypothetical protein
MGRYACALRKEAAQNLEKSALHAKESHLRRPSFPYAGNRESGHPDSGDLVETTGAFPCAAALTPSIAFKHGSPETPNILGLQRRHYSIRASTYLGTIVSLTHSFAQGTRVKDLGGGWYTK